MCHTVKAHVQRSSPLILRINVTCRNEAIACDIAYADTHAIHDGSTSAVIFVGVDTQLTDVYCIKTGKQPVCQLA